MMHLITEKNIRYVAMFSRTNALPTVRVDSVMLDIKVLTMQVLNKILEENHSRITFEQFDEILIESCNRMTLTLSDLHKNT